MEVIAVRTGALGDDTWQGMLEMLQQHDIQLAPAVRASPGNVIQQLYAGICAELLLFNPPDPYSPDNFVLPWMESEAARQIGHEEGMRGSGTCQAQH